jgi:hypothetical protein
MCDEGALTWLRQLLGERISHEISLRIIEHPHRQYYLSHDDRAIEMPVWEWGLGTAVESHCCYDAEGQGWHAVMGKPLPAPGTTDLHRPLIERNRSGYTIRYDILGLTCWALSRAEEVGRNDLDGHGRFPATSSHAHRHGYLGRPLVDEWLSLLRQVAQRLWPRMKLTDSHFETRVSHDVDQPSAYAFCSPAQMVRGMGVDVLRRKDLCSAVKRPWLWLNDRQLHAADPCNTFRWIMDVSESRGMRSAFYFVCGRTEPTLDPNYDVDSPAIRDLIRVIHHRGHEVGLHPSYGTYRDPAAIKREAQKLLRVCAEEGVSQDAWGGRMHYLRWSTPVTLHALGDAGMAYDATLGYADLPGFRCGTCHEYTALDPFMRQPLKLRIRPLIAMDGTVLTRPYMALGVTPAARDEFVKLKHGCRAVGGSFTLLWHNSLLTRPEQRRLYEEVLEA